MNQLPTPFQDDWIVDAAPTVAPARTPVENAFFGNFAGKLRRRWRRLVAIGLLLSLAGIGVILSMPKVYRASTSVIVDASQPDAGTGDRLSPELPVGADTAIASEIEIINSRNVLASAAQALHLTSDPEFNPNLHVSTLATLLRTSFDALGLGAGQGLAAWFTEKVALLGLQHLGDADAPVDVAARDLSDTIDTMLTRMSVQRAGLSRVVEIGFSSYRPDMAAKIANTIAGVYAASNKRRAADLREQKHELIEQRLIPLRVRAANSAAAVETFRSGHGLVRGKDSTVVQEQVTQISSELMRQRTELAEAQTAVDQMRISGVPTMDLAQRTAEPQLIGRLREQAAQLSLQLAELTKRYGADSPPAEPVRAKLADLARSIASELDRQRQTLNARVALAKATEATLAGRLASLQERAEATDADTSQVRALEREASADQDLYISALNRWQQTDLLTNFELGNVRVLSQATVPTKKSSLSTKLQALICVFLSFGVGVLGVLFAERGRPGLLSMDDVEQSIGLAPLGLTPYVPRRNPLVAQIYDDAISLTLARILMMPIDGRKPRSVLVTSALPREGKTTTAIALARAAAAQGIKVLLVDADLRSHSLTSLACHRAPRLTLSDLLLGRCKTLDDVVFTHTEWDVAVLPGGLVPGAPTNLLGTGEWDALQGRLMRKYDLVVIDSPPVLLAGDAWLLARHAESTVMLSRWRSTAPETVAFAVSQLMSARARLVGVLLTMVSTEQYRSYRPSDAQIYSPMMRQYYSRGLQRG